MRDMTSVCRRLAAATLLFTLISLNAPKALAGPEFTIGTPAMANASFASGSPVTITWQGGDSSWNVNVSLIDVEAWAVAKTIKSNMRNDSPQSVDWAFPSSLRCDHTYQFSVAEENNIAWAYGLIFTLACDPNVPKDWFSRGGAGFTLTAPLSTDSFSSASPVAVTWEGGDPTWNVNLSLIDVDAWAVAKTVKSSKLNNPPTFNWAFPSSLPCNRRYQFYIAEENNITWAYGQIFTLACLVNVANDWNAQAQQYRGQIGTRRAYGCPPGDSPSATLRVWGTDSYTDDSAVCEAAVHMGLITPANGGTVIIVIGAADAKSKFSSSTRFGYTSQSWDGWYGSFSFAP